jgi:hypothetical protein
VFRLNFIPETIFQSWIDFKTKTGIRFDLKIADRFRNENRGPIFPERFLIAIVIAILE